MITNRDCFTVSARDPGYDQWPRSEGPVAVIAAGSVSSVCTANKNNDKNSDKLDTAVVSTATVAAGSADVGVILSVLSLWRGVSDVRGGGHGLIHVLLSQLLGRLLLFGPLLTYQSL